MLVVALVIACCTWLAHAESDDTRLSIVAVGNDPEFVAALEELMVGNNTGVKAIGDRPTPSLAELGPESRRLADEHAAIATVWLSPTAAGATLVTYERTADRFVVREVPYKIPLDATQAIETARMVSVMLRAVRDRNDEAAVTQKAPRIPVPPHRDEPRLLASLGVGGWFASPEAAANPMATLVVAWRPYGFGAAASATFAPASDIATMSFLGDVRVWRVALEARKAVEVAPGIRVSPGLGMSLHAVTVAGELGGSGESVDYRRYNPALQISTTIGIALTPYLEVSLALAVDSLLRTQRYTTEMEDILAVPRIQAMMAILIGVRL